MDLEHAIARLDALERETKADEVQLETARRSIRALSVELAAPNDARQFEPQPLAGHRPPEIGDAQAMFGLGAGLASGAALSYLVFLLRHCS